AFAREYVVSGSRLKLSTFESGSIGPVRDNYDRASKGFRSEEPPFPIFSDCSGDKASADCSLQNPRLDSAERCDRFRDFWHFRTACTAPVANDHERSNFVAQWSS